MGKADIPIDVFISCKNLDEHGVQTRDSEIAAEVYKFLTGKGLRVFLSTYTLEQLGAAAYTRAIDSALESATVLLAIGTSVDHLNSGWVRHDNDRRYAKYARRSRKGFVCAVARDIETRSKPSANLFTDFVRAIGRRHPAELGILRH
jgi:hypothetical protein